MLYPILKVVMTPLAAVLLDTLGVAWIIMAGASVFSLVIGFLGEVLDYRACVTTGGAIAMLACWLLIFGRRKEVRMVYDVQKEKKI